MKFILTYTQELEDGKTHTKWTPSTAYDWSVKQLIAAIEKTPEKFDDLLIPIVLTLTASLEASLNDWILIDTFGKHGANHYKPIAEAYVATPLAKKARLAVAVMTDNKFRLNEDSSTAKKIDELIACRNKITHPLSFFQVEEKQKNGKENIDWIRKHPLQTLTISRCKEFHKAIKDLDRFFFHPYDVGKLRPNKALSKTPYSKLLEELEEHGTS